MNRMTRAPLGGLAVMSACLALAAGCASKDAAAVERARLAEERIERVVVVAAPAVEIDAHLVIKDVFILEDIRFDEGSVALTEGAQRLLDKFADWLDAEAPGSRLELYGHTDGLGTTRGNRRVALRRGEAVRAYLHEKRGVAFDRMVVVPVGESAPLAANDTPEGRRMNRRVAILVR